MPRRLFLLLLPLLFVLLPASPATAQETGWVIRSFAASYQINEDGSVNVQEDILVDFLSLTDRHGIFREIPVEYRYDANHNRVIEVSNVSVDNGSQPWRFTRARNGANLQLKIGDADKIVRGQQRYRISYRLTGVLNAQEDEGEFYWNVVGDKWLVTIEQVTAAVISVAMNRAACYEGPVGSDRACQTSRPLPGPRFEFASTRPLPPGSDLTIVIGLTEGRVAVPPPMLIEIKSPAQQVVDFMGLKPLPLIGAVLVGIASLFGVLRLWWAQGRDRWRGDVAYLTGQTAESTKPLFARETIVTEYEPPDLPGTKRRLRPAEVGLLVDERADTLDVSATIVDLAVRGHLKITEIDKTWVFGKADYRFERLPAPQGDELLPYEATLLDSLFETANNVEMSDLRNKFYDDLAAVKKSLYEQGVKADNMFSGNPESSRMLWAIAGVVLAALGVGAIFVLGATIGAGIMGVPIILAGLVLGSLSGAMARRTGQGRELLRRSLGFKEYMVTAETDRARFAEEAHIFDDYLPYAIVFGVTEKWARAFEGLQGMENNARPWYSGTHAFVPIAFASNISSFSSSLSGAISSSPSSSGSSGFSGGSSGGGMGGGGGGSW